jgi:sugar phosphate isomerase/epimerase
MDLALSTSWNAFRFTSADEFLAEIRSLGFKKIELSFNLSSSMTVDIAGCLNKHGMEVVSVHNYCPTPQGLAVDEALPDCFSMSSPDEKERQLAVKYTKATIDTARFLGAEAVVLHCGRVEIPDKTRELISLAKNSGNDSKYFVELRDEAIKQRAVSSVLFFENTLKSLGELNRYAEAANVSLGIENRFYYREIPSYEETGIILKEYKGSRIFYWHDAGHARIMEDLGFSRQVDYLCSYGGSMLGMHLHDVWDFTDHLAPSQGDLDFSLFKPFVKNDTLKVMEVHYPVAKADLMKGREFLETVFYEKRKY